MPRRESTEIKRHETNQRAPFWDFINVYWREVMVQPLPPFASAKNTVTPVIEYGRWLVLCPADGCTNANVVSRNTPFWICATCGSPENDEVWYNIDYPDDADDIEAVLLKRPEENRHSGYFDGATGRHVLQDLDTLRAENRANGLSER